jgi:putative oxidoreductase
MSGPVPASWGPRLLSLLRIVAGLMFMTHGLQKLFAWPANEPQQPVDLISLMGLAGVLETFGGFLIVVGLFTRPVAFVLAGEMAVAYFKAHAPQGFWPLLNHGEPPVLYCFLFLYLAAVGGGVWSLDALRSRPDRP